MVVAVIKASWLQTPLFVRLCFPSIKTVFRMPVARLSPPHTPPFFAGKQSLAEPPWTLELSREGGGWETGYHIWKGGRVRNRSGPAHTLIIWLVKVFSCNNAWSRSLSLSLPSRLFCGCNLLCANTYTQMLINKCNVQQYFAHINGCVHKSNLTKIK